MKKDPMLEVMVARRAAQGFKASEAATAHAMYCLMIHQQLTFNKPTSDIKRELKAFKKAIEKYHRAEQVLHDAELEIGCCLETLVDLQAE